MKRILLGLLIVCSVVGLIGVSTWSFYNDIETSHMTATAAHRGTFSEAYDTYLAIGNPYRNYGVSDSLDVIRTAGSIKRVSLIKFPHFIGPNNVPQGANIISATLTLNCTNTGNTVYVYKLLDQWIEGNIDGHKVDWAGEYGATTSHAQKLGLDDTTAIDDADGISASDTSVTVDPITISNWPTEGLIMIDSEIIWYGSRTATSFNELLRGVSGTTASPHPDGAMIKGSISWVDSGGADGAQGDSRSSTAVDSFTVSTLGTYVVDVTSAVQDWVNNPETNFGVILQATSDGKSSFSSSEASTIGNRPLLTVTYNPPPTPPEPTPTPTPTPTQLQHPHQHLRLRLPQHQRLSQPLHPLQPRRLHPLQHLRPRRRLHQPRRLHQRPRPPQRHNGCGIEPRLLD